MEILSTLGINWALLLAQMVNFAIVLFVLSKFVYRPLLQVIDQRREAIRKAAEDVERIAHQKEQMERTRQEMLKKADSEAGVILEHAKTEAEAMRKDILENAQKQAAQILDRGEKQLEGERARVFGEVQEVLATTIMTMTEKILRREFTADDQKRLLQELERELPALLHS